MLLAALALAAANFSCLHRAAGPPNVILITLDTTRADHLGCYGDARAHTPTLDSLAASGVRFSQAVTPVPLTCPSHASMLTALNPTRHGVRDNGLFVLDASFPLVAEQLREHGYQTGAFVSAFVLARQFGLARGFEIYDDRLYGERTAIRTTQAAIRWIDTLEPGKPFFLWVHYFDPHTPWTPPEPFRSMDLPTAYDQEIAAMDAALAGLLRHLRTKGLLRNTVLAVAGDHGEGLGDHGEDEHGIFLYDEALRVPLLLDLPRGPKGRVVDAGCSLIDLAPTLLDAAGFSTIPGAEGTSLLPLLRGQAARPRRAEYGETFFPEYNYDHSALRSMRTPRWKLIRAPEPELYNLTADPEERTNLYAQYPETVAVFQDRLDRYLSSLPALPSGASSLSPEDLERLRSLGYLSGGEIPGSVDRLLPDPKAMIPILPTFTAGKQAFHEGRLEEAERDFREVLDRTPGNLVAALDLGKTLLRLKRDAEAAAVLKEAWRRAPQNATLAKHLGEALRRAGRPSEALVPYQAARLDVHQRWSGVIGMVGCLIDLGRLEEARDLLVGEAADTAAGLRPQAVSMARRLTQQVERFTTLKQRQTALPSDETVRLDLAGAAFDLGLLREARRALRFQAGDPHTEGSRLRILGSIAGVEGNRPEELMNFEKARERLPDDPYILQHLAALYLELGRVGEALKAAKRAEALGPPDPILLYNQACAYARLGQLDAGLAALRRAVQLGYANASRILEDPDLAPLAGDPRFQDLAERAARR